MGKYLYNFFNKWSSQANKASLYSCVSTEIILPEEKSEEKTPEEHIFGLLKVIKSPCKYYWRSDTWADVLILEHWRKEAILGLHVHFSKSHFYVAT